MFLFSSGKVPTSGIAGWYGSSITDYFEETSCCIPQWLHQFISPPTIHKISLFYISSPTVMSCLLTVAILTDVRYVLCMTFFYWKNAYLGPRHFFFFNWAVWFFDAELYEVLICIFLILSPYQIYNLQISSPNSMLHFPFHSFLHCAKCF